MMVGPVRAPGADTARAFYPHDFMAHMPTTHTTGTAAQQRRRLAHELAQGQWTLAEACRRLRETTGLNQKLFARMLGIAERTYIDLERGVGNPTLETLEKIGQPFGWRLTFAPMHHPRPHRRAAAPAADGGDDVEPSPPSAS